jgi:hypothetical protein
MRLPRCRVGVNERGGQPGNRVQQSVLSADRDLVRLRGDDVRVENDLAPGADLVADPAEPYLPCIQDARWRAGHSRPDG